MVAEPAEAPADVTNPEPSTPASDALPESPSLVLEESPPESAGEETPATGEETRQPDSYSLTELDQLYKDGKLSDPSLVERREGLRKSEDDRQRETERVLYQQRQEEEQRATELQNLGQSTRQNIRGAIENEIKAALERGREPDIELIAERIERQLSTLEERTREIHLNPHERGMRSALLRLYGDTPQNRRAVDALSLPDLTSKLYEAGFDLGRKAGPGEDFVVEKKAERQKAIDAAVKKELDAWKAANPGASPPSGPARQTNTNLPSRDQWTAGTYEQRAAWKSQHGEDVADRIFSS